MRRIALFVAARSALGSLPDRYNVAVRDFAGVLFIQEGRWKLAEMRWGLVPSWEKQPDTKYSTQAARLERAPTSRLYRRAWATRRCLAAVARLMALSSLDMDEY